MKKPESICIFGDSTAWGAWDLEKGGWANRLWFHVAKRDEDYVEIYNLSISGGTTETILERFEHEAKIRNADALIFQTGGNDASLDGATKTLLVEPKRFEKNIREIISRARKITNTIAFTDLRNCDETKTTPVWWKDVHYTNENMQRYSKIMEDICREENVLFIDVPKLKNSDFDDGLHPNVSGHEKIFTAVRDSLTEHSWI